MLESLREHRLLLEAFESADADLAETCMREHLRKQYETLVAVYEVQGQAQATGKEDV